jgi:hypothetical protein
VEHGRVRLIWFAPEGLSSSATVYRRPEHGDWAAVAQVEADASGRILCKDVTVSAGQRYGYRLGVPEGDHEVLVGETWVDLPAVSLKVWVSGSHPTRGKLPVSFTLPDGEPAKVELLDVAGRRVVSRVVKDSGMESQTVILAEGREVPPGIYVVRLIHRSGTVTAKACVIR